MMITRITGALLALAIATAPTPEPDSGPDLVLPPVPTAAPAAANGRPIEPARLLDPHSTVIWPKVDGYSDPNRIVYDQANFDRYVEICRAARKTLFCGTIGRKMTAGERTVGFDTGFTYYHAGDRFHVDRLRTFLRARIAGATRQYADAEAVKQPADIGDPTPYIADVCAAVEFLGAARTRDALPELHALLADPDEIVGCQAARALGKIGDRASLGPLRTVAASKRPDLLSAADWAIREIEEREK